MTSLASLTHAAAAPGFNTDFYVTAATVIPVLFLALAVQGPAYRKVLHGIWTTCLAVLPDLFNFKATTIWPYAGNGERTVSVPLAVLATVIRLLFALILALVLTFGIAIIAAGGYGELLAVYALYQQHDQSTTRHVVLIATMFLVILIAAGPLVTYLINAFGPEPAEPGKTDPV